VNLPRLFVERRAFMAWVDGVLLDRQRDGTVVVGDLRIHEEAEKLMMAGGIVGLLVDGKPASTMTLEDDGFVEREAEHE